MILTKPISQAAMTLLLVAVRTIGPAQAAPTNDILVDEIIAVVNRHLITMSEVREEVVLLQVEHRGRDGPTQELSGELLKEITETLIDQQLLLDEANKLGLPLVSEEERRQVLESFKQGFRDAPKYQRFLSDNALDGSDIADALVRHLRVERLKENKLLVMPAVTAEAVREYYERNRLSFGGATFEVVAEAIRLRLITQQGERWLTRWMSELRKHAEVKVLIDLAAAARNGG
jgi:SurA N-terminal domain.